MQVNNDTVYKLSTDAVLAIQTTILKCLAEELPLDLELRSLEFKYANSKSPKPTLDVLNPPRSITMPIYDTSSDEDAAE